MTFDMTKDEASIIEGQKPRFSILHQSKIYFVKSAMIEKQLGFAIRHQPKIYCVKLTMIEKQPGFAKYGIRRKIFCQFGHD